VRDTIVRTVCAGCRASTLSFVHCFGHRLFQIGSLYINQVERAVALLQIQMVESNKKASADHSLQLALYQAHFYFLLSDCTDKTLRVSLGDLVLKSRAKQLGRPHGGCLFSDRCINTHMLVVLFICVLGFSPVSSGQAGPGTCYAAVHCSSAKRRPRVVFTVSGCVAVECLGSPRL